MGPNEEPGTLALLFGLAAALYAVTRLLAGPPGSQATPARAAVPSPSVEVALPVAQPGPAVFVGLP